MGDRWGLIIEAHLGLMMDLRWVPQMAPLMVPMIENPWFNCFLFQFDNMFELMWVLLMVLLTQVKS